MIDLTTATPTDRIIIHRESSDGSGGSRGSGWSDYCRVISWMLPDLEVLGTPMWTIRIRLCHISSPLSARNVTWYWQTSTSISRNIKLLAILRLVWAIFLCTRAENATFLYFRSNDQKSLTNRKTFRSFWLHFSTYACIDKKLSYREQIARQLRTQLVGCVAQR